MSFSGWFCTSSKLHTFVPNLFKAPQKMTLQALSSTEMLRNHAILCLRVWSSALYVYTCCSFTVKKQWYCILPSLLSRKLTHLWGSELEASHICSKIVKSSRKRYLLRPELHKNRPHANLLETLQANIIRMEAPWFFQGHFLRVQSSTRYV